MLRTLHQRLAQLTLTGLVLGLGLAHAADYTDPATGMQFIKLKGGSYLMGDLYGNDQYAKPPHKVTIQEFYLAQYEVTFEQYDRFCEETKREKPEDNGSGRGTRPVINVSRDDAIAFAAWLSQKTKRTFRLPSEAEWEYAARGGKSTAFWWGNQVGSGNANCAECGSRWDNREAAPVGSFRANPYGLHDMNGNVYEWVSDSWKPGYDGAPTDGSARLDPRATEFISRGGSYREVASSLTVFARNWSPSAPYRDVGFRLVMEP